MGFELVGYSGETFLSGEPRRAPIPGVPPPELTGPARVRETDVSPRLPSVHFRHGVGRGTDVGIRSSHLTTLGFDVKRELYRSMRVDIAVAPSVEWFLQSRSDLVSTFQLNAPLMVGLNSAYSITWILLAGPGYALSTADVRGSTREQITAVNGPLVRAGAGLQWRLHPRFALQPEASFARVFAGADSATLTHFGLGIVWGSLPRYDELK